MSTPTIDGLACVTPDCTVYVYFPCTSPEEHDGCHGTGCPNCGTTGRPVVIFGITPPPNPADVVVTAEGADALSQLVEMLDGLDL